MKNPTKVDAAFLAAWFLIGVYGLVLIPLRPYLVVNHPTVYAFLTGGKIPMVVEGASSNSAAHHAMILLIGTLSVVKFLPLYYYMFKRWGEDFLNTMFITNEPPRWFTVCRKFYDKHPIIMLVATFIPFSPVPFIFTMFFAVINKTKGAYLAISIFTLMLINRTFYMFMGHVFGEQVSTALTLVDKYMLYITIATIVLTVIMSTRKNSKKNKMENNKESATAKQ